MSPQPGRVLITGANGHLGRQLIARLCGTEAGDSAPVRALVRSDRAAEQVRSVAVSRPPEIVVGDYTDPTSVRAALEGCDAVVHLVGIIKEGRGATYASAHEETCTVLAEQAAAAGIRRIVYLSIVGSRSDADNPCLASKGRAEQILLAGPAPTTVIRVPMVLGESDAATRALRGQAHARLLLLVRGGATLQQPIDARDVVAAVIAALRSGDDGSECLELGGPERLSHRALVERAAAAHGRRPRVVPIPLSLARGAVRLLERLLADPPITVAMLDVLQHDDRVDETKSCERLGIRLTPLDETLRRYVGRVREDPSDG